MNIRRLLRYYRGALWLNVVVSYSVVLATLLLLLAAFPHAVHYLLDVISPVSKFFKDLLLSMFPEVGWLRRAGEWMGAIVRRGLSYTDARTQAIGRLTLLDGPILVTLLAWMTGIVLRIYLNYRFARWFSRRYDVVPRQERMVDTGHIGRLEHREVNFDLPLPPRGVPDEPKSTPEVPAPAPDLVAERFDAATREVLRARSQEPLPRTPPQEDARGYRGNGASKPKLPKGVGGPNIPSPTENPHRKR